LQPFHRFLLLPPASIKKTAFQQAVCLWQSAANGLFLFSQGSTRRDLVRCVRFLNHNRKELIMAAKKKAKKKAAKKKK